MSVPDGLGGGSSCLRKKTIAWITARIHAPVARSWVTWYYLCNTLVTFINININININFDINSNIPHSMKIDEKWERWTLRSMKMTTRTYVRTGRRRDNTTIDTINTIDTFNTAVTTACRGAGTRKRHGKKKKKKRRDCPSSLGQFSLHALFTHQSAGTYVRTRFYLIHKYTFLFFVFRVS